MTTHSDPYHIDDYAPFRESKLWELQRNYFKHKGIKAWQGEVPFYISSNAFIARRYAKLVLTLIQEYLEIHPECQKEVFYISELGSGVGKFSFYFLKSFFELQNTAKPFKICYIMTDVVDKNKLFWEQNAYFQSLSKEGVLQFKLWNIEEDEFILPNISLKTPLIVIANYVFDCTKHDVFKTHDQKLNEIQVQIKSRYKHYDQSKAEHLKELRFQYLAKENLEPYSDAILNNILKKSAQELPDNSFFTVPVGALNFLKHLEKSTNNNYFILAGDKGVAHNQQWGNMNQEDLFSYEGSYAFMVNFNILGQYLQAKGGDRLLTNRTNIFKICLYSSKINFSQLTRTTHLFEDYFERFCADEFCYLNEAIQSTCNYFSLKSLISHLRLSHWDMNVYQNIHDRLLELIAPMKVEMSSDLIMDMKQVEENVYYYPGTQNVYNQLGIFYQIINQPQKAIELYKKALHVWGESTEPHHNLGLIYEKLGETTQALHHYKQSLLNQPIFSKNPYAKRRIQVLTGHPFAEVGQILMRALFVFSVIAFVFYYLVFVL